MVPAKFASGLCDVIDISIDLICAISTNTLFLHVVAHFSVSFLSSSFVTTKASPKMTLFPKSEVVHFRFNRASDTPGMEFVSALVLTVLYTSTSSIHALSCHAIVIMSSLSVSRRRWRRAGDILIRM